MTPEKAGELPGRKCSLIGLGERGDRGPLRPHQGFSGYKYTGYLIQKLTGYRLFWEKINRMWIFQITLIFETGTLGYGISWPKINGIWDSLISHNGASLFTVPL